MVKNKKTISFTGIVRESFNKMVETIPKRHFHLY